MPTRRRWLQFSLRTAFVFLTLGCVWLGWKCEQARTQREAVKAIEALGGLVIYDWHPPMLAGVYSVYPPPVDEEPPGPAWLRRLIGNEFFQEVVSVGFDFDPVWESYKPDVGNSIPHLQRLRGLKQVVLECGDQETEYIMTKETLDKLNAALPKCDVTVFARR